MSAQARIEIWRSPEGITLINAPGRPDRALRTAAGMRESGSRVVCVSAETSGPGGADNAVEIDLAAAVYGVDMLVTIGGAEAEAAASAFLKESPGGRVERCQGLAELAGTLRPVVRPGDVVLMAGFNGMDIETAAARALHAMAPNRMIVDLQSVAENVSRFRRVVGPGTMILGMVKALAYGSEVIHLPAQLQELGFDWLGVSTADEGAYLRRKGISLPILVTLCTPEEAAKVVQHDLIPAVYSFGLVRPLAEAAGRSGKKLPVHIKIDTGMGRVGVMPDEAEDLARAVEATGVLYVAGLMTHEARAEDPDGDDYTRLQIARFNEAAESLRRIGYHDIICHASATGGSARFPQGCLDMVRIGIGLYGIYPGTEVEKSVNLELAVSLTSRIIEVRELKAGSRVGYGGTFETPRDGFRVGIIPLGYHDGLPRGLSNVGSVLVDGSPSPIIGRVSMDSAVLDLSRAPSAAVGSKVLIYGKQDGHVLRPESVASLIDTIAYELVTRVGPRVQRIYLGPPC